MADVLTKSRGGGLDLCQGIYTALASAQGGGSRCPFQRGELLSVSLQRSWSTETGQDQNLTLFSDREMAPI